MTLRAQVPADRQIDRDRCQCPSSAVESPYLHSPWVTPSEFSSPKRMFTDARCWCPEAKVLSPPHRSTGTSTLGNRTPAESRPCLDRRPCRSAPSAAAANLSLLSLAAARTAHCRRRQRSSLGDAANGIRPVHRIGASPIWTSLNQRSLPKLAHTGKCISIRTRNSRSTGMSGQSPRAPGADIALRSI